MMMVNERRLYLYRSALRGDWGGVRWAVTQHRYGRINNEAPDFHFRGWSWLRIEVDRRPPLTGSRSRWSKPHTANSVWHVWLRKMTETQPKCDIFSFLTGVKIYASIALKTQVLRRFLRQYLIAFLTIERHNSIRISASYNGIMRLHEWCHVSDKWWQINWRWSFNDRICEVISKISDGRSSKWTENVTAWFIFCKSHVMCRPINHAATYR